MLCGMQTLDPDWLIPDWPAPRNVRAICTTRQGGVSQGRYASLNLGLHVNDAAGAVLANREHLRSALEAHAVFLNQTHGFDVLQVNAATVDGLEGDAAMTSQLGVACTVMVADCLPVLLCDATGTRVAAAHAGWRGLLGHNNGQGILEQTVIGFATNSVKPTILAWLGPCIGPSAFEVGDEVRAAFVAQNPRAAASFQPVSPGKWLGDLPHLARQRLAAMGVMEVFGNDGSPAWCTVGNQSRFFSHRRDGISGRQAACIWRVA